MLTFKDVKYSTWEESMEAISLVVKDEYKRHPELSESTVLDEDVKNYIVRMEKGALSSVELQRSLLNLARMLSAHHGSKVVILVDEYDTPIQQGYSRGFYKKVISFMRNFLSGGQAKPYWANISDNEIIREILTGLTPEIADDLAKVMQGI